MNCYLKSPGFRRGRESRFRILFGYDDPCKDIDDYTRSEGENRHDGPDEPDDGGINIQMLPQAGTDSPQYPVFF